MQAAEDRIQAKAELADDRRQLLGLLCLAAAHSHICASLGLDKKLTKSLLDLHHKVSKLHARPCPALNLLYPMLCAVLQSAVTTLHIVLVLAVAHAVPKLGHHDPATGTATQSVQRKECRAPSRLKS